MDREDRYVVRQIVAEEAGGGGFPPTLSADTTVDLNGKILKFDQGGQSLLNLDPVSFQSTMVAADGTAAAGFDFSGNSGGSVYFDIVASDGGSGLAEITGDAQANTLSYTAGTQTLNGEFLNALMSNTIDLEAVLSEGNPFGTFLLEQSTGMVRLRGSDGTDTIEILMDGIAQEITHTADTHTFNGRVIGAVAAADDFADDAAATSGGVPVGGLYHTAGVVKINLPV